MVDRKDNNKTQMVLSWFSVMITASWLVDLMDAVACRLTSAREPDYCLVLHKWPKYPVVLLFYVAYRVHVHARILVFTALRYNSASILSRGFMCSCWIHLSKHAKVSGISIAPCDHVTTMHKCHRQTNAGIVA